MKNVFSYLIQSFNQLLIVIKPKKGLKNYSMINQQIEKYQKDFNLVLNKIHSNHDSDHKTYLLFDTKFFINLINYLFSAYDCFNQYLSTSSSSSSPGLFEYHLTETNSFIIKIVIRAQILVKIKKQWARKICFNAQRDEKRWSFLIFDWLIWLIDN